MSAEKYKSIIFFDFFRQKERREKSPNVLVIVYYMLNFLTIIPVAGPMEGTKIWRASTIRPWFDRTLCESSP